MHTIHKYPLERTDRQVIKMPKGAGIIHVGMQYGEIMLWADIETERTSEDREIMIVGTGNPIKSTAYKYIGSVMDSNFVWHIFEVF